jgi:hypothetical protein
MRRNPWLFAPALAAAAVLGATWVTNAASTVSQTHSTTRDSTLAGTWSGRYSGAFSGTFTIHWTQTGSSLHGTITLSNPRGKYAITGSVLRGSGIKFGAVSVGATYTGSVSGKTMSGSYKTPQGSGKWSAHKTS